MPYRDVLDLTPVQAVALLTKESDPPGLLQPHTKHELVEAIRETFNGWR